MNVPLYSWEQQRWQLAVCEVTQIFDMLSVEFGKGARLGTRQQNGSTGDVRVIYDLNVEPGICRKERLADLPYHAIFNSLHQPIEAGVICSCANGWPKRFTYIGYRDSLKTRSIYQRIFSNGNLQEHWLLEHVMSYARKLVMA